MSQLSSGICRRLNEAPEEEIESLASGHTVQLLSVKKVSPTTNTTTPTDRYRIIISDGVHFVQAMLATQLNELVTAGQINKNTVVVIDRLACNFVSDKR
jgi:replication factor A1